MEKGHTCTARDWPRGKIHTKQNPGFEQARANLRRRLFGRREWGVDSTPRKKTGLSLRKKRNYRIHSGSGA